MMTEREPDLTTDPAILEISAELESYEPVFHRPEKASTRAEFEQMTCGSFWEIGASGQRYSREYVLHVLDERRATPVTEDLHASGFYCQKLATGLYLFTYNLVQDKTRKTRRVSIWRRHGDGWKIVFHQGTIVQG